MKSRYRYVSVNGVDTPEHRVIWEKHHGKIPEGYVIHHIDGNGHNNDVSNLMCLSKSAHRSLHARMQRLGMDPVDTSDPVIARDNARKRERAKIRYANNRSDILRKHAEYRESHKSEIAERQRDYRVRNQDVLAIKRREKYARNKSRELETCRKYYAEHKEQIRELHRQWRLAHHSELIAAKKLYYQQNKAYISAKKRLNKAILTGAPQEVIAELSAEVNRIKSEKESNNAN